MVAWNCWLVPLAMEGLTGVTPIEPTETQAPVVRIAVRRVGRALAVVRA